MTSYQLPTISSVPTLSSAARAAILDHLFEPSTPLHTLSVGLLHDRSFASYNDLISAIGVQLVDLAESSSTSDTQWLDSILGAHPRLGERNIDSTQSQGEQAHLKSSHESDEKSWAELNGSYEKAFPGLRYVVFVNGKSRSTIVEDLESRISRGDICLERTQSIKAMCDIAADRASKSSV